MWKQGTSSCVITVTKVSDFAIHVICPRGRKTGGGGRQI